MEAALVFAAYNGDARKVAELLSQGGRVDTRNDQGFTPLLNHFIFQSFVESLPKKSNGCKDFKREK